MIQYVPTIKFWEKRLDGDIRKRIPDGDMGGGKGL